MITSLSIKNYALINDIQVSLEDGLTMITGETGAGKSILLGALSLLLGKRADLSSVRNPQKKCIIEGVFNIQPYDLQTLFDKNDLDYEPQTILRREILPGGKSRSFINDTPVNLSQLQSLAPYLVDVHSQHETGLLSKESFQLDVIDALAATQPLIEDYKKQLKTYKALLESLSSLRSQKADALKELDYNTFLYEELREADLHNLDQQELEEQLQTLSHAEEIKEQLSHAIQLLSEEQIGGLDNLKEARQSIGKIKNYANNFEVIWERLNSMVIELEDILNDTDQENDKVEVDPAQLLQVETKLQTIYKLQQKHTVSSVEELLLLESELAEKVDTSLHMDERIENLERESLEQKKKIQQIADQLHTKRKQAIPLLKEKLEHLLAELGLPNAQFRFEFSKVADFKANGSDHLNLLFTANKGASMGSIKKVASGGEMSRIMLAIKAVLAQYRKLPTLIFDEIDTGISGEIALRMANIMDAMSASMQVISITHLPQIAAKGAHHIKVFKKDQDEGTETHLQALSEEERIVEIAQMIGGHQITEAALANAKELLN